MGDSTHHHGTLSGDVVFALPFLLALLVYLGAAMAQRRRHRSWPWYRMVLWLFGVAAVAAGFVGPLAQWGHGSFTGHVVTHVLVGMAAPLALVLAAPVTLALRTLDVVPARRLSRVLRSLPVRMLGHPVVAATIAVGSLWVLYFTPLYALMQENLLLHWLVLVHFALVGMLYTAALIPVDPAPHRAGYRLRAVVLVLSLAAHGILSKLLYASPPPGVAVEEGRAGAVMMFYAGDLVDLVIIAVLCAQWYRESGRRLQP